MDRFINLSAFQPENFLGHLPLWSLTINGYSTVMIFWNLLLAAVAVWLAYRLARAIEKKESGGLSLVVGLLWLLMLPNTAYIMTDGRHIIGYCPPEEFARTCRDNAWMTLFFFAYAAVGWYSFVQALLPVTAAIGRRWKGSEVYAGLAGAILSALGVMLGLVNRWNSWEVVTDPLGIFWTFWRSLGDLTYLRNWLIMSVLLYILFWVGQAVFRPINRRRLPFIN